jgi:hypothetical protein
VDVFVKLERQAAKGYAGVLSVIDQSFVYPKVVPLSPADRYLSTA